MAYTIFVSSVQAEFAKERAALRDYVLTNNTLKKFFDVFLFEDTAATDRHPTSLFLEKVDSSDIYVCLLGRDYGTENEAGISPTEQEFTRATEGEKPRLVFLKRMGAGDRDPKMQALVERAQTGLVRKTFDTTEDLVKEFDLALAGFLAERLPRPHSFAATACPGATLDDLDPEKMAQFVRTARLQRDLPLPENTPPEKLLTHLDLLDNGRPTNAAVLLFGKNPQKLVHNSDVMCMHFHGTEATKPIPSYHIYTGTVFELIEQAVDFVLSKISQTVGTREESAYAPRTYEIPAQVVTEAIVNAVVHRDYTLASSVQVMLFTDRLDVVNSGTLPPDLTPERLRVQHPSRPRNPAIAQTLLWTKLIERAGSGTLDMIRRCAEAELREPEFASKGFFTATVWRTARKICAISVTSRGKPINDADVLVTLPGGKSVRTTTDSDGVGHVEVPAPGFPFTVFAARHGVSACARHGWVPAQGTLAMRPDMLRDGGSVILHERQGSLPGLRGNLEFSRDSQGEILLHAHGFSVCDERTQPIGLDPGNTVRVVDQVGRSATVRLVDMAGRAVLLEYVVRSVSKSTQLEMLDNEVMTLLASGPLRISDLLGVFGKRVSPKKAKEAVRRLLSKQLVEQTQPDRPRSPTQKYRLTSTGRSSVASRERGRAESDDD